MKRKIEKFLAHKVGVDEALILADEDGRYDLKGDFDGALAAVRGKEVPSANRGRSSNPPKSAQSSSRRSYPEPRQIGHFYHAPYAPPPPPPTYSMTANPGFSHHTALYHQPHHASAGPMMPIHGKENSINRNYPPPPQGYWTTNPGIGVQPPALPAPAQPNMSPHPTIKSALDDDDDFASACLLSAKKSIFDTPPKLRVDDEDTGSISKIDIRGMTPPDTDYRNTFRSPMADSREGTSLLTKDEAFSLNKSLFSEAVMSTPCHNNNNNNNGPRNKNPVRFGIGQEQDTDLNNRVSVSPIQASAVASSYMPTLPKSEKKSVNFKVELLTPNEPSLSTNLTPFDSGKMAKHLTTTPSTAATADQSSFWSEMSPGPLSPFTSPDLPLSSTPKKRRTSDGSFGQ
jgi:hypothetical protein